MSSITRKKKQLSKDKKHCSEELELIKASLKDFLLDTQKIKEDIKQGIQLEVANDTEFSYTRCIAGGHDLDVADKLIEMRKSIDAMNFRLSNTENQIKIKNNENYELKDQIFKLKESILEKNYIDQKEVNISCNSCTLF